MELNRKGLYFSLDALIAVSLIFLVLLVYNPHEDYIETSSDLNSDLLQAMSNLKVYEIDNVYVQGLIASGDVRDPNSTILEQIGEFYTLPETYDLALEMSQEVFGEISPSENVGIWFSNGSEAELIFSSNRSSFESAENVNVARQFISGISKGQAAVGYAARAYLSNTAKIDYFYFGGYIGDGNVSVQMFLNGTVNESVMELAINSTGNFTLYVNDAYQASYSPSSSLFQPATYNIPTSNFTNGTNIIEIRGNKVSIAGGYIKITSLTNLIFQSENEKYLPGVDGIVNVYDSFYVPSVIEGMNATLHLNSTLAPIFFIIGNTTVWNGTTNASGGIIYLDNSTLASKLNNFSGLNGSTIPIRVGIEDSTIGGRPVDVMDVSDLSGSMAGSRMTNAKNATRILIGTILNYSQNRIGLAGFATYANKTNFHNLSNDNNSLINIVNNVWNASGGTCICCGILKALSCYDPSIFSDNFNGQTVGSNPFGWITNEGATASVDISSQSIEGNRAVLLNNTLGATEIFHIFNPQQDNAFVNFKFNHLSGNGHRVIFSDNFNGQAVGANPSGWTLDETDVLIDITSQSIEGNRAVLLNRTAGTISMTRAFSTITGYLSISFSFNHLSGSGILRADIEDTSNNDFIQLRTSGGWIQNNAGGSWTNIVAYNSNSNYSVVVGMTPGSSVYDVKINGVDYLNLPVFIPRSSFGGLGFYVQSNNAAYLVDNVTVLTNGGLKSEVRDYDGNSFVALRTLNGYIQNNAGGNWQNVVAYNLNSNYNISMLILPSNAAYNLTINGISYPNLQVITARSNIAQLDFLNQYGNATYLVDDINISLTSRLCQNINSSEERQRYMIVMTDGDPTITCGLQSNVQSNANARVDAINASCLAHDKYNFTVYTVGFETGSGTPAENTLIQMADCGEGNYTLANVNNLVSVYETISDQILQATYSEQAITSDAYSRLYPDSHIDFLYEQPAKPSGLVFTLERLFSNSTRGNFTLPINSSAIEVQLASYSGPRWTSLARTNGNTIYNLTKYGVNYTKLGDPYRVNVPVATLNAPGASNDFDVFTATSPNNVNVSSPYNKIIYRIAKNATIYTELGQLAYGCNWTLAFEDGSVSQLLVPENYGGDDVCVFNQTMHTNDTSIEDSRDVYQVATFNLFEQIDIDSNGLIDFLFLDYKLKIFLDQVEGIPFEFSTEVQSRIWR